MCRQVWGGNVEKATEQAIAKEFTSARPRAGEASEYTHAMEETINVEIGKAAEMPSIR